MDGFKISGPATYSREPFVIKVDLTKMICGWGCKRPLSEHLYAPVWEDDAENWMCPGTFVQRAPMRQGVLTLSTVPQPL